MCANPVTVTDRRGRPALRGGLGRSAERPTLAPNPSGPRGPVQLSCEVCGDRFFQGRCHFNIQPARCCSQSCSAEWRSRRTVDRSPPAKVSDADFAALLVAHQRLIRWVARRRFEHLDADDVVQETNLLLWRLRAHFDPDRPTRSGRRTSFASFAARQVWNAGNAVRKARARLPRLAGLWGAKSRDEGPAAACERAEVVADVRKAVGGMPRRQRERIEKRLAGVEYRQIAAEEGVTRQSVEVAIQKAKATLRGGLGRHAVA